MRSLPQDIELSLDQRHALELRAAGATFDEIAQEQGVNKSTAKRRVDAALDVTLREPADHLRELEMHRIDRLFTIAYRKASEGSLWGIDRCIALMDRRAKLMGLDAPARSTVTVLTRDQWAEAMDQLEAQIADAETRAEAIPVRGDHS